ncbi:MAG TPA: HEAT repeat domain-containing protein [Dissulfurispiraceae bacterium]
MKMRRGLCVRIFLSLAVILSAASAGATGTGEIDKLAADLHSGSREARFSAVDALGRMKDEKATEILLGVIEERSDDWKLQIRAIRVMGSRDNPKFVDLLLDILNDPFVTNDCPAMKWNAATALGNFGKYPRVFDALVNALHDRDLYVREAAAESLGQIGDKRAAPFLLDVLHDKSFAMKASAIRAIRQLHDPAALSYLKRVALSDKDAILIYGVSRKP